VSEPPAREPADAQEDQRERNEQALARAAEAGIHRLAIPTPFQVGRVNAYLIEDEPLTLVDSGPNSAKALDELEQALEAHGHRVEDIGLLVITHQHMDHFGLAAVLARRSGAEVAALDVLAPYLASYSQQTDLDDRFAQKIMLRHGIPPEIVTALRAVSAGFRAWGSAVEVTRPLADSSTLELGERQLRVLHRPGHSPSDTLFYDDRRRFLLAADHLIAHISSNPLLARPLDAGREGTAPRPRALLTYMASREKTREMDLELVLPGHGPPITDHVRLIEERFRMHRRRAERMRRLIASAPRTAHEIAQELWGNVAVTQAYLTLSEVLGHLDMLLADGSASEHESDGVVRFRGS
jgi:glyoxylase-like metal-dependent hydrolase (beta-lactamase superfamily II)